MISIFLFIYTLFYYLLLCFFIPNNSIKKFKIYKLIAPFLLFLYYFDFKYLSLYLQNQYLIMEIRNAPTTFMSCDHASDSHSSEISGKFKGLRRFCRLPSQGCKFPGGLEKRKGFQVAVSFLHGSGWNSALKISEFSTIKSPIFRFLYILNFRKV